MGSKPPKPLQAQVELNSKVTVRELPKEHPAYNKHSKKGLFATENIARGELIGEYIGIPCTVKTKSSTSRYTVKRRDNVYIDATIGGNETMFINDYRNIRDAPNVKYIDAVNDRVRVIASQDIKQGEEMVVDYGDGYCKRWGIIQKLNS
jgi:SET domain-containing protein